MPTKTISSTKAKLRFGELIESAIKGTTTIVERYSRPLAVLVGYDEYQRLKGFEAALLAESRRVSAENDANDSWTSGEEMRKIMAKHGVVVD